MMSSMSNQVKYIGITFPKITQKQHASNHGWIELMLAMMNSFGKQFLTYPNVLVNIKLKTYKLKLYIDFILVKVLYLNGITLYLTYVNYVTRNLLTSYIHSMNVKK